MSRTYTLFLILTINGCATSPAPNPWDGIEASEYTAEQPLTLAEWPEPTSFGDDVVTFDLAGAKALTEFKIAAETNTDLATEHALEIDQLNMAVTNLAQAGAAQYKLTEMSNQILAEERQRHFYEKITYWVLLLLFGAAAVQ